MSFVLSTKYKSQSSTVIIVPHCEGLYCCSATVSIYKLCTESLTTAKKNYPFNIYVFVTYSIRFSSVESVCWAMNNHVGCKISSIIYIVVQEISQETKFVKRQGVQKRSDMAVTSENAIYSNRYSLEKILLGSHLRIKFSAKKLFHLILFRSIEQME